MEMAVATVAIDPVDIARRFREYRADSGPAYQRLKDLISEQLLTGRWPEGELLPSESQLVDSLGLSRMTVNRALRELSAEGLVTRVRGVGTFVADRKGSSALFEVHNIADEVRSRGHEPRTEVVQLQAEQADPRTRHLFGLAADNVIFRSRMVHFEDEVPIQLEDRHVHPAVIPGYLEQDFTRQTPNDYLSAVAPLTAGEHVVEAVLGTTEECGLLHADPAEPCLLIHRRTWSQQQLVSATRLLHPGSRYRLEGAFESP